MRCGPQAHVYNWQSTSGDDGFPPEGATCMCGAEEWHRKEGRKVLVVNKNGICERCGKPIDDHEGAKPCR